MKRFICTLMAASTLLLALLPVMAVAAEQASATPPPISQPLVTEAILAVNLATALGVSSTTDYVTAESALGDLGISPHNGWIADYPVTPDIVGEVRESVAAAADNGELTIGRDEAVQRFDDVIAGFDLTVRSYQSGETALDRPISCETYPNPAMINDAYSGEGPPIVTYYCPPPDYYGYYAWVPYPFWWTNFWYPGFFILKDFDRHVHLRHHYVHFSNHFRDVNRRHFFRIDPVDRFHGRTYPGIGVRHPRHFFSTGVPRSSHRVFNPPRSGSSPRGRHEMRGFRGRPPAVLSPGRGSFGSMHGGVSGRHGGVSGSHGGISGRHGGVSGSHGGISSGHGGVSGSHGGVSGSHRGFGGSHGGRGGMRGGGMRR